MENKPFHVLLVEDDYLDAHVTKKYLAESIDGATVEHINDGITAMDYLLKRKLFRKVGTPDLLVLDLNLPGMTGLEIIKFLYAHKELRKIPTIVVSGEIPKKSEKATFDAPCPTFLKWLGMKDFKSVARAAKDIFNTHQQTTTSVVQQ